MRTTHLLGDFIYRLQHRQSGDRSTVFVQTVLTDTHEYWARIQVTRSWMWYSPWPDELLSSWLNHTWPLMVLTPQNDVGHCDVPEKTNTCDVIL